MERVDVANRITDLCNDLERRRKRLEAFVKSEVLPQAMADYDEALDIAIVQLRSEGVKTTLVEKRAKGRCKDQLFKLKKAEIAYKTAVNMLKAVEVQLGGYQSVFKQFSEM